ncbi:MAG TPA: membrane protein insertion efficiency factor YidD [Gammaproteobacteria bacterium]|nr:membrane protein insertion efficiency factor YidD [Gammaproteobacteria bacterium]
MATITDIPQKIVIGFIKLYQFALAPFLGQHCRFFPSCSHYMQEAIKTHGLFQGIRLGTQRLLRCHPFCEGGIDPIPERKNNHD